MDGVVDARLQQRDALEDHFLLALVPLHLLADHDRGEVVAEPGAPTFGQVPADELVGLGEGVDRFLAPRAVAGQDRRQRAVREVGGVFGLFQRRRNEVAVDPRRHLPGKAFHQVGVGAVPDLVEGVVDDTADVVAQAGGGRAAEQPGEGHAQVAASLALGGDQHPLPDRTFLSLDDAEFVEPPLERGALFQVLVFERLERRPAAQDFQAPRTAHRRRPFAQG